MKVSVNLAKKYKVKAKKFITTIFFLRSLENCFIFFEDFFKASKEQITINEI